jgi:hypothetical protein
MDWGIITLVDIMKKPFNIELKKNFQIIINSLEIVTSSVMESVS